MMYNKVLGIFKRIRLILLAFLLSFTLVPPESTNAASTSLTYPISSGHRSPGKIVDLAGSVWYTETTISNPSYSTHIGKLDKSTGTTSDFDIKTTIGGTSPYFSVTSLVAGPDGNIWFGINYSGGSIGVGKLDTITESISAYSSPQASYGGPGNMVLGSDGNIWWHIKSAGAPSYTYLMKTAPSTGASSIGRTLDTYSDITSLTDDKNGRIYYADSFYKRVSYLDPLSSATNTYNIPTSALNPTGATLGADGNIWLIEAPVYSTDTGKIAVITSSGNFTEYPLGPQGYSMNNLRLGRDGGLWGNYSSNTDKKIGRIAIDGSLASYSLPSGITNINSHLLTEDGTVWFSSSSNNGLIGKLVITPDFSTNAISSSFRNPSKMTSINGNLWYLETKSTNPSYATHIAKMDKSTGLTTDFDIKTAVNGTSPYFSLGSLVASPDGNIWFSINYGGGSVGVGKLDALTGSISKYLSPYSSYGVYGDMVIGSDGNIWWPLKSAGSPSYTYLVKTNPSTGLSTAGRTLDTYSDISSVTSDANGRIYYTDLYYKRISYIDPVSSASASYTIPSSSLSPTGAMLGSDGNIWFVEAPVYSTDVGKLAKLTPTGIFTEYPIGNPGQTGYSMGYLKLGADGALWGSFSSNTVKKIGRVATDGSISTYSLPTGVSSINSYTITADGSFWFSTSSSNGILIKYGY